MSQRVAAAALAIDIPPRALSRLSANRLTDFGHRDAVITNGTAGTRVAASAGRPGLFLNLATTRTISSASALAPSVIDHHDDGPGPTRQTNSNQLCHGRQGEQLPR